MSNVNSSFFLTLEGIDGVGKSTQAKFIETYLRSKNISVVMTREPGGTSIAEAIRHIVTRPEKYEEALTYEAELLLLFASRAQHIKQVIRPALMNGQWVICDRFTEASYAYQGGGRKISFEKISFLEAWIQCDLHPYVLLLDMPIELALQRAYKRGQLNRIEAEQLDFFQRVREAYLKRAACFPERYKVINADNSVQEVQTSIKHILDNILRKMGNA